MRFNRIYIIITACFILSWHTSAYSADPLDNWRVRDPFVPHVQDNRLRDITYGNGVFVAVGERGSILSSEDGISWSISQTPGRDYIFGVTYGKGVFLAVGHEGTFISQDGRSWLRSSAMGGFHIAYGNGTFVMSAFGSGLYSSQEGVYWTDCKTNTSSSIYSSIGEIAYGNGVFVALAGSDILTSPDGETWSWHSAPGVGGMYALTYGNNIFVAVGAEKPYGNATGIMTSVDGVQWTLRDAGHTGNFRSVAYGNNTFVAVGPPGMIATSQDGAIWTFQQSGIPSVLWSVAYGNGIFVAVGDDGLILSSEDGSHWTPRSLLPGNLVGIAYGGLTYLAVGYSSSYSPFDVLTSSDGLSWQLQKSGFPSGFTAAVYGNEEFIAVGDKGKIARSPNGIDWTSVASGSTAWLKGVGYGNNTYIAVGSQGTILTSRDGTNWSAESLGPAIDLSAIIFAKDTFIAVGSREGILTNCQTAPCPSPPRYGIIFTSPDGLDWTEQAMDQVPPIAGIAYGSDILVAVSSYALILSSTDGKSWTQRTIGEDTSLNGFARDGTFLNGVAYGNGTFAAVGRSYGPSMDYRGIIVTSNDGVNWTLRYKVPEKPLSGIIYANNVFTAVGAGGTILQSDPFVEAVGVPTVSEWGMILFSVMAGIAGLVSLSRLKSFG